MSRPADDVRMQGFTRRQTVAQALAWIDAQIAPLTSEAVALRDAAARVLATSIVSDVDVPGFDRATMDGYAVVADTTDGATPYTPLMLAVIGESLPGRPFAGTVGAGEAVRIMTGAPVPAGCDAVLPAEWVEPERTAEADSDPGSDRDRPGVPVGGHIKATASVSPGKHVGRRGEDIAAGTTVLEAGRLLRPQDVGVLSSIGIAELQVVRRPRVRLVITGNELLPAGSRPEAFRIADANGPMLAALAERDGAVVDFPGLVPDEADAILTAMHTDADVVLVSGGSSVGAEDLAPMLLAAHGELAVHGIAMRPSSPTGMGRLGTRLVFLLPGNPVSSICAYDFFAGRAVRVLGGRPSAWPYRAVRGRLTRKISSPVGRLDYARVRVSGDTVEPLAVAGASILSSTTRADGFVIVDENSEGYGGGAEVTAWLYA
jgi:molybdopterin molybdotransferase